MIRANHSFAKHSVSSILISKTMQQLKQILARIIKTNLNQDEFYSTFTWNTLIRASTLCNSENHSISLYTKMHKTNIPLDSFTFTFTLKACSRIRNIVFGEQIHAHIAKTAFEFHDFVHSTLMSMYAKCGRIFTSRQLFDEFPERNQVCWCVLINGYIQLGAIESARELFDEMPERDPASLNAMINGYTRCGKPEEALNLFEDMKVMGLKANRITLLGVLSACGELGYLDFGMWVHSYIDRNLLECGLSIQTALVSMYSKCGREDLALEVFDGMERKDGLAWTAIICGLAINGRAEKALDFFSDMERAGVKPDEVTFIGVLSACSHSGLVVEGRRYFERMSRDFSLEPKIVHYGCMVDMFGRAGLMEEAYRFIETMPVKPNGVVWRSLLAACRVHGKSEMAESVAKHLEDAEVGRDDNCVILSNVYAEGGRWREVERVRRVMKEMGKQKKWGTSSLS